MLQRLFNIYRFLVIILTIIVLYSTTIFGTEINDQILEWKLIDTHLSQELSFKPDQIAAWRNNNVTVLSNKNGEVKFETLNSDPMLLSPVLKTIGDKDVTTVVEFNINTVSKGIQIFWATSKNSGFTEENSIILNNSNNKITIDGDVTKIRIDPTDQPNSTFIVKNISIKKYVK